VNDFNNKPAKTGLTLRAVLASIFLILAGTIWTNTVELYAQSGNLAENMPSTSALTLIFLFMGGISLVKWLNKSFSFKPAELMVVYVSLLLTMVLASQGLFGLMFTNFVTEARYAVLDKQPSYIEYFKNVPAWLVPHDKTALAQFYDGAPAPQVPQTFTGKIISLLLGSVPWSVWIKPLLAWGAMVFVLYFTMLCIVTIVRKQWTEKEKFTFPLATIPLSIVEKEPEKTGRVFPAGFFRNKFLWIGIGIATVFQMVNGLHHYYPIIPSFQPDGCGNGFWLGKLFKDPPLSAMAPSFLLKFNPLVIGVAYLLNLEILFSIWFFVFFERLQRLAGAILGLSEMKTSSIFWGVSKFPFGTDQTVGALAGILIMSIWIGRRQIFDVLRKAFRGDKFIDDSDEPMSFRFAVIGAILGFLFLAGWAWATGAKFWAGMIFFGLVLFFATSATKIRAEAGVPSVFLVPWVSTILYSLGGAGFLGVASMNLFAMMNFLTIGWFCVSMPTSLEGYKIADAVNLKRRSLTIALLIAFVTVFIFGAYFFLSMTYKFGGNMLCGYRIGAGSWMLYRFDFNAGNKEAYDPILLAVYGISALFAAFLSSMRLVFLNWPFHPLGYALSNLMFFQRVWGSFMVAWIAKVLIIKYGGVKMYKQLIPLFLGLFFGDIIMHILWSTVGLIVSLSTGETGGYLVFPP